MDSQLSKFRSVWKQCLVPNALSGAQSWAVHLDPFHWVLVPVFVLSARRLSVFMGEGAKFQEAGGKKALKGLNKGREMICLSK